MRGYRQVSLKFGRKSADLCILRDKANHQMIRNRLLFARVHDLHLLFWSNPEPTFGKQDMTARALIQPKPGEHV
jgi:hypothetical protein